MRNNNASHHVHHLQRAFAIDDDIARSIDEGKGIIVAVSVSFGGKHQFETRGIVGGFGGEGVGGWPFDRLSGR